MTSNHISGKITIEPPFPLDPDTHQAIINDAHPGLALDEYVLGFSIDDATGRIDGITVNDALEEGDTWHDAADIAEILGRIAAKIPAGHTFADYLSFSPEYGHHQDISSRIHVVNGQAFVEDSTLFFWSDLFPANGQIVDFDPAAARTWLADVADDAGIDLDGMFLHETCQPGDWVEWVLRHLDYSNPVWRTPDGVTVEAIETIISDVSEGGVALAVQFPGLLRIAPKPMSAEELVTPAWHMEDGAMVGEKTQLDAAVEALQAVADAVNSYAAALIGSMQKD